MAFFKSKYEKEILSKLEKEEQMNQFNSVIAELKNKKNELIKTAAEAELNGDGQNAKTAKAAAFSLGQNLTMIEQTKTNFDIINLSNACGVCMATAMNVLDKMADSKYQLPNLGKIQKTQLKLNKYMRNMETSRKAIGMALNNSNPANVSISDEDLDSIQPLVDAKKTEILSRMPGSSLDLAQESAGERSKIF